MRLSPEEIVEIEKRMRPGVASRAGFLGASESLLERLRTDDEWLRLRGITHEQIADRLETMIGLFLRAKALAPRGTVERMYEDAPRTFTIYGRLQMMGVPFAGFQECPFDPGGSTSRRSCGRGSSDFAIARLGSEKWIPIPELAIHLIRDHHFFEGDTPYRVDPAAVVDLLEIRPNVRYTPKTVTEEIWDPLHQTSMMDENAIAEVERTASSKIELDGVIAYRIADELVMVTREHLSSDELPTIDGRRFSRGWHLRGISRFRKREQTYHLETPWEGVE